MNTSVPLPAQFDVAVADPMLLPPRVLAGSSPVRSGSAVTPKSSRRNQRWLGLALLLFLLQTLPFFSYRWLTDESWYTGPGVTIAQGTGVNDPGLGPNELEHTFDSRPPGTALLMAAFFRLFGVSQTTARLGSLLAGAGSVFLIYLLMSDLIGAAAARWAALIAATDNLLVLTARTARPEALTTFSILLGLWAVSRYARRLHPAWALAAGLIMAMGTMFHITLLGYIVSGGLLLLILDVRNRRFPLRGVSLYTLGYALGLIPYIAWIRHAGPIGMVSFRAEFLSRVQETTLLTKLIREFSRYSDLLGFGMLHEHGLASVPVRLPIPLVFLLGSGLLWRYRRSWFYIELLLLIPEMLWLVDTANKSSRYLALLAPVFAMVIGIAVDSVRTHPRLRRAMTLLAGFVVVAQFGANLFLLHAAQKANYNQVGRDLRRVIPPGATAYGTITFWLALRDRNYISYERTDPEMAADRYHARYFIVGDPMMTQGSVWDNAFYQDLNRGLQQVEARGHAIAVIPSGYYGDLKVYELP